MKKFKLDFIEDFDFDLLGVMSSYKDFTLAWALGQKLEISFSRINDIIIELRGSSLLHIPAFYAQPAFGEIWLLKNKIVNSPSMDTFHLLNELPQLDYFIKIKIRTDDFAIDGLISLLKSINHINYLVKIDMSKIKNKENLLF